MCALTHSDSDIECCQQSDVSHTVASSEAMAWTIAWSERNEWSAKANATSEHSDLHTDAVTGATPKPLSLQLKSILQEPWGPGALGEAGCRWWRWRLRRGVIGCARPRKGLARI